MTIAFFDITLYISCSLILIMANMMRVMIAQSVLVIFALTDESKCLRISDGTRKRL